MLPAWGGGVISSGGQKYGAEGCFVIINCAIHPQLQVYNPIHWVIYFIEVIRKCVKKGHISVKCMEIIMALPYAFPYIS